MGDSTPTASSESRPPNPRQAKTWDKAKRLSALLTELQARRCTTADLARRFDVGQRSIQRDIDALRRMGHDVVQHAGQTYSIPRNGTLLRPAEALAAYAAIRLAHHHSPALNRHYRHALHSISMALPERIRHTLNASVCDTGATPFAERQMEMVAAAWMDGRVLNFDYRRPNGQLETGNELCVSFIEISRDQPRPVRHRPRTPPWSSSYLQALPDG